MCVVEGSYVFNLCMHAIAYHVHMLAVCTVFGLRHTLRQIESQVCLAMMLANSQASHVGFG